MDPAKITTFVSLAAAAFLTLWHLGKAHRLLQVIAGVVILVGLGLAAWLEWSQHRDYCADSPDLEINEYCAGGRQCRGGEDFVEIINRQDEAADLGCYALVDLREARGGGMVWANPSLLPAGQELHKDEIGAWSETDTGFRLSAKGDRLRLSRLIMRPGEPLRFIPLGQDVLIDPAQAFGYRTSTPSHSWVRMSREDVENSTIKVGTFGTENPPR